MNLLLAIALLVNANLGALNQTLNFDHEARTNARQTNR
jgi:hypothetical protein